MLQIVEVDVPVVVALNMVAARKRASRQVLRLVVESGCVQHRARANLLRLAKGEERRILICNDNVGHCGGNNSCRPAIK